MLPAGGCPPARLAVAGAGLGVAAAVGAALAGELAEPSPVVGVAGAVAAHGVAAPVGVARAAPLAVVAPVLLGAACEGKGHSRDGEKPAQPPEHPAGFKGGWMAGAERGGGTHGSCSPLRRSRVGSGTARVSRTPRPPCRRPLPRTRLSRQERHSALSGPPSLGSHPTYLPQGQHSQENPHPASRSIPPAQLQHQERLGGPHGAGPHWQRWNGAAELPPTLGGSAWMSVGTALWDSSPSITHRPCTPSRPASSRDSTPGRPGTCGRDLGVSAGAGGPGRLQGLGQGEAILAPVLRRQRGPQGNAPEGNQKNRRKFRRL